MNLPHAVTSDIKHLTQMTQRMMLILIFAIDIWPTDAVVCVKRAEIGDREGNLYNCDDPSLTECCERNRTFTCCEPQWHATLIDQLWVMFALLMGILMLCLFCNCYNRQSEFFRAPTAKEAAQNWKNKIVNKFDSLRGRRESMKPNISSNPYTNFPNKDEALGYPNKAYIE